MHEIDEREPHLGDGTGNEAVDASSQFLGRAVWFQCKDCRRVQVSGKMVSCENAWDEQAAILRRHQQDPQDIWWFQTVCERCHPMITAHAIDRPSE